MICIGKIIGLFGLNGYLKVKFYSDDFDYKSIFLENGQEIKVLKVKDNHLMLLESVNTRTLAEPFLNKTLWIKDLKKIDNTDEYYFNDLIGLKVMDEEKNILGVETFVNDYGAGTFLDLETCTVNKVATIHFNAVINIDKNSIIVNKNCLFYN